MACFTGGILLLLGRG